MSASAPAPCCVNCSLPLDIDSNSSVGAGNDPNSKARNLPVKGISIGLETDSSGSNPGNDSAEQNISIVDGLSCIFPTSLPLVQVQDSEEEFLMCMNCGTALSTLYEAYFQLLQLSNANSKLTELIKQIEIWHSSTASFCIPNLNSSSPDVFATYLSALREHYDESQLDRPEIKAEPSNEVDYEYDDNESEPIDQSLHNSFYSSVEIVDDNKFDGEQSFAPKIRKTKQIPNSNQRKKKGTRPKLTHRKKSKFRNFQNVGFEVYKDTKYGDVYLKEQESNSGVLVTRRSKRLKASFENDKLPSLSTKIIESKNLGMTNSLKGSAEASDSYKNDLKNDTKAEVENEFFAEIGKKFKKSYTKHQRTKPFIKCTITPKCSFRFKFQWELEIHRLRTHEKKVPGVCQKCQFKYYDRELLKSHICIKKEKLKAKQIRCGYCGKWCESSNRLACHAKKHDQGKSFVCTVEGCKRSYRGKLSLEKHIKLQHLEKRPEPPPVNVVCDECGKLVNKKQVTIMKSIYCLLQRHKMSHQSEKRFGCAICGKSFRLPWVLSKHKATVHQSRRPYKCPLCGLGFKIGSALRHHYNSKVHKPEEVAPLIKAGIRKNVNPEEEPPIVPVRNKFKNHSEWAHKLKGRNKDKQLHRDQSTENSNSSEQQVPANVDTMQQHQAIANILDHPHHMPMDFSKFF